MCIKICILHKFLIPVSPQTSVSISPLNQTISESSNTFLVCTSEGGPNNTYQWQVNGTDIMEETSAVLVLSNVQASTGGMYICVVSNAAGSDNTGTYVFISPYFITQPTDIITNNEASITLVCEVAAFPSPAYQWGRVNGLPIRDGIPSSSDMLVFNPVMFGDEGEYYCNASSMETTIRSQVVTVTGRLFSLCFCDHTSFFFSQFFHEPQY